MFHQTGHVAGDVHESGHVAGDVSLVGHVAGDVHQIEHSPDSFPHFERAVRFWGRSPERGPKSGRFTRICGASQSRARPARGERPGARATGASTARMRTRP